MKYFFPFLALFLIACSGNGEDRKTDQDKMRDEVRSYMFLADSVKVAVNVVDTIMVSDLDGMIATISDNIMKVQWDIDTLNAMMDEVVYDTVNTKFPMNVSVGINAPLYVDQTVNKEVLLLNYELKMAELESTKKTFQQSKRVMLHLRRAQLNTIAGYEISANYSERGENIDLSFLMTANFKIVD